MTTSSEEGPAGQVDVGQVLSGGSAAGHWTLDPDASRVEIHAKTYWGLMTVHGSFTSIQGQGEVGPDGTVSGELRIDAGSVDTKNSQRDTHLRSPDFFDVGNHPTAVISVTSATAGGPAQLACTGSLEVAGRTQPLTFEASVDEASADAATLRAAATVDRTQYGLTWNRIGMVGKEVRATAVAHFVRDQQ